MKVSHEVSEDLSGVLKVSIEAADYADKITSTLKSYRKKADMPGFRKGHVPMGMIKKMYGNSVLGEEQDIVCRKLAMLRQQCILDGSHKVLFGHQICRCEPST